MFLRALFGRLWAGLLAAAGVAAGLAAIWFNGRQAGVAKVEAADAKRDAEADRAAAAVLAGQARDAADRPHDRADRVDRLRRPNF